MDICINNETQENSNFTTFSRIFPSTIRLEPAPPKFLKTLDPIYGIQSDIFNYVE